MLRFASISLLLLAVGCGDNSGPPNASETSATTPKLTDRIKFVEQYVKFRRKYDELEYDISFKNGGSFPPAPSEWDVRIVAIVPPDEIDRWVIPGKQNAKMTTPDWVDDTAQSIDVGSITEWYADGGQSVGIDRQRNIVAYRNLAY